MNNERWFISYRFIEKDFLTEEIVKKGYNAVITDVTPARWVLYSGLGMGREHNILYAEKISLALASELVYGGAGITSNYFREDGD